MVAAMALKCKFLLCRTCGSLEKALVSIPGESFALFLIAILISFASEYINKSISVFRLSMQNTPTGFMKKTPDANYQKRAKHYRKSLIIN